MSAVPRGRRPAAPPRGLLHPSEAGGEVEHLRLLPGPELSPYVAHFWSVRWSLPAPRTVETLPHPTVHLVFEEGSGGARAEATGVQRARFVRELAGRGEVFGVKLRPATFGVVLGRPVAELRDRVVPIGALLGDEGEELAVALAAVHGHDEKQAAASRLLAAWLPPLPPEVSRLRDLVERVAVDASLVRAADLAELLGCDLRALERAFRRHVGATPKWVIQRYRLHEAAERLRGPSPPSLSALAAELGYADQAHLQRDFRRVIGQTPRAFQLAHAPARRGESTP